MNGVIKVSLKIVAISDVHGKWNKIQIPKCDILISAGDYSFRGERHMVKDFHRWLNKQPAKHIISVQGNHELLVEKYFLECKEIAKEECNRVHFIEEDLIEIEEIKIYCSAWTPYFNNWAYNAGRTISEAALYQKPFIGDIWNRIPDDIDILVTHGPPYEILDLAPVNRINPIPRNVGCERLKERIKSLKKLTHHIFGHIHNDYGIKQIDGITYINASICNEAYQPLNEPIVVDYEK